MDDIIRNREYGLVICRRCGYSVMPAHINSHLRGFNHRAPDSQRQQIQEQVSRWPVHQTEEQAQAVIQRINEMAQPVEGLAVHSDGFQCAIDSECQYICRSISGIKKHCVKIHGWVNSWKSGQTTTHRTAEQQSVERPWRRNVQCQTFFTMRTMVKYFPVRNVAPAADSDYVQVRNRLQTTMQQVRAEQDNQIGQLQPDDANPWLERTGWLRYLSGWERDAILSLSQMPGEDDPPSMHKIHEAVASMIQRSQRTVCSIAAGVNIRKEASRSEKPQAVYMPLNGYQDVHSSERGIHAWQRIIAFIGRSMTVSRKETPRVPITAAQRQAFQTVWMVVEEVEDEEERGDSEREEREEREERASSERGVKESEDEERDRKEERRRDAEQKKKQAEEREQRLNRLERAVLELVIALLDNPMEEGDYDSAVVCALAALGMDRVVVGWLGVNRFPQILSALIKTSQFIVVQAAFEQASETNEHKVKSRVTAMVDQFMIRGSHGPMEWMRDLRAYGLKIHHNTTGEGKVHWQDDRLMYGTIEIDMPAQLRGMIHSVVAESRALMEEILCAPSEEIPRKDWSQVRDQPVNRTPRWSLVQDERNQIEEGATWLLERIMSQPRLKRRFLVAGSLQWKRAAVEKWMGSVRTLLEKLLVLMHMTGGQPGRGPEILSIRHRNGEVGMRNLFVEDGMWVFVTRYHKNYSKSGQHKIIQRYLPAEVGVLLGTYLWLVWPLWEQWAVEVMGVRTRMDHLWNKEKVGGSWTSEKITRVLGRETGAHAFRIGLAAWREIAIATSRRFMRAAHAFRESELTEWEDEEGMQVEDAQAAHSSAIAGQIYARLISERDGETEAQRVMFRRSSREWHRLLGFVVSEERGFASVEMALRKRKRAVSNDAQQTRLHTLRRVDLRKALQAMTGRKDAEFRGIQRPVLQAIVRQQSPIVAVMATGMGKSLLFMLPAFASRGGVTVVVVPLIALRQDMMQRVRDAGVTCAAWKATRPPDGVQVVLVTPESAVGEEFAVFLNRLVETRQLDRIVVDEAHVVLNRQWEFRRKLQRLGELGRVGVQMVMLTATLPPSEEMRMWEVMRWRADEVDVFRDRTRRTNIAYRTVELSEWMWENNKRTQGEELAAVRRWIRRAMRRLREQTGAVGGKVVIYCNSVDKTKAVAEAMGWDAYHHHARDKDRQLERFQRTGEGIVATSAFGMGIDVVDIRLVVHLDEPRTLSDYAQESGRAGRDGLKSKAVLMIGKWGRRWEDVAEQERVEGLWKCGGCTRALLDAYLDGWERMACEEGEEACQGCRAERDGGESDFGEDETEEEVVEEITIVQQEVGQEEGEEDSEKDGEDEGTEDEIEEEESLDGDEEEGEDGTDDGEQDVRMEQWRQAAQRKRVQHRLRIEQMSETEQVAELRQTLDMLREECPYCRMKGLPERAHPLRKCIEEGSSEGRKLGSTLRDLIRIEKTMQAYSGCMWCYVPQAWCDRWKVRAEGGWQKSGEECQYDSIVMEAWAMCWMKQPSDQFKKRVRQQRLDPENHRDVVRYMGQRVKWAGLETNRLMQELWWMMEEGVFE